MIPGLRLYIEDGKGGGVFGDGRAELLDAIDRNGSISGAADELGRGYRKAWEDIRRAEAATGRKLVRKMRGGARGGRTELTDFGTRLLGAWKDYREAMSEAARKNYASRLEDLLDKEKR